jgi:hypothetical protein
MTDVLMGRLSDGRVWKVGDAPMSAMDDDEFRAAWQTWRAALTATIQPALREAAKALLGPGLDKDITDTSEAEQRAFIATHCALLFVLTDLLVGYAGYTESTMPDADIRAWVDALLTRLAATWPDKVAKAKMVFDSGQTPLGLSS